MNELEKSFFDILDNPGKPSKAFKEFERKRKLELESDPDYMRQVEIMDRPSIIERGGEALQELARKSKEKRKKDLI